MFCSLIFIGCVSNSGKEDKYWKDYEYAMSLDDYLSATYSLNQLASMDSTNMRVLDTLGRLYQKTGNYKACYYSIGRIHSGTDMGHIKLLADCSFDAGMYEQSMEHFKIWVYADTTGDMPSRFRLAQLQYNYGNKKIAYQMLSEIVEQDESGSQTLAINNLEGGLQNVSYYCASHNLAGEFYFGEKDYKTAQFHFNEASTKDPNFALAKYNLYTIQNFLKEQDEPN